MRLLVYMCICARNIHARIIIRLIFKPSENFANLELLAYNLKPAFTTYMLNSSVKNSFIQAMEVVFC